MYLIFCSVAFLLVLPRGTSGQGDVVRGENDLMWCCLSPECVAKCMAFAEAAARDNMKSEYTFGSYYHQVKCKLYSNKDECMRLLDDTTDMTNPNIMTVDAGEVFVGGRYHSLVPVLREVYHKSEDFYHSVAVVKKNTMLHVETMDDLRGAKACFPKVGSLAGWTIPIYRLIREGVMKITDCNNHVQSAISFFGKSCAVNSLQDRYNPLGDNPHHFCELCGSDTPGVRCSNRDPYAEYEGALICLKEKGDVAFLNDKVIFESADDPDDFELLCPVKSDYEDAPTYLMRKPLDRFMECSWGVSPSNAVVVSSAMPMEMRESIQRFLDAAAQQYGSKAPFSKSQDNSTLNADQNSFRDNEVEDQPFQLFDSMADDYGGKLRNLMFSDSTRSFRMVGPQDMSYKRFLSKTYGNADEPPMKAIEGVRKCPVGDMQLCVTSDAELTKCVRMKTALNAQLLKPKLRCKKAQSHLHCMQQISRGEADIVVLDAGDVYRAGWSYDLIPIMAEIYNLGTPHYYAVAVTKQRDNSSELIYLKKKYTCHTGVGHGAGWVIPMAWLIANERVRDYGCDSVRAAAEYFGKACAPGALSAQYQDRSQPNYWEYSHLCDLCHGTAGHYCKRNHMEDYFGHTGAFRCLVEGGGNVAFVKHTTVMENCDGKRKEWWARNQLTSDYELLCRDGTRAPARAYKSCYLGKVNSNAVVTRKSSDETLETYIKLFKYAQQFYGQKVPDEFSFSMFISEPPYADLIFQDATQQLIALPKEQRDYTKYLDKDFLKAYTIVECRSSASRTFFAGAIFFFPWISVMWWLL